MKKLFVILSFTVFIKQAYSQDFEFPKGWVLNLEYLNGFTSSFHSSPESWLTRLHLNPQITVVPKRLRAGVVAGIQYNNKKVDGLFGPSLAFKIKTLQVPKLNSSLLNLQWTAENLYGTGRQHLIGTGLRAEVAQLLLLSLNVDRDYRLAAWHFGLGIGINFIQPKVPDL